MLGCRGRVKGGRRDEGFSGWNVERIGPEGSYSTRWSRQNQKKFLWFSRKEKETIGVGSFRLRNYGRLGLLFFLRKMWIIRLSLGAVGKLEMGMSYVSVVRKNDGLTEEIIWLQIGEGVVQGREKKLRRCLVGKFGEGPFSVSKI